MRNASMVKRNAVHAARVPAVVLLSLALGFTSGCNRDPNVRKQKYLESGKRYEASGKHKEAAIQFTNALKVDKNFGDAHYELAKTYLKMNNPNLAYAELLRTVDLAPSNLDARITLGNLLLAGGAPPERADAQAQAVLAINPNYPDAYALLAGVAERRGDRAEALKDIQHALELAPNKSNYHSALAVLEASSGNAPNAEQELAKATSLDPKNATPHILLGNLLARKGDTQGAQQQFLAAVSAAPNNLQARGALASLYFSAGDKPKAEQALREGVEANPDLEGASAMLLQYYGRTNDVDGAERTFADLTQKYPKSTPIKI